MNTWTKHNRPTDKTPVKRGDNILFEIHDVIYKHTVDNNQLWLHSECRHNPDKYGNGTIFNELSINKCKTAESYYGYHPTIGIDEGDKCWPEFKSEDWLAITRLVCYLFDYIQGKCVKKVAPPIKKVAPPVKTNILSEDNLVTFVQHDGHQIRYRVKQNHLEKVGGDTTHNGNDAIFNYLNLTSEQKYKWANFCYEYPDTHCGVWPISKNEDYAALTRFVDDIQRVLNAIKFQMNEDYAEEMEDINVWDMITDAPPRVKAKKETPEFKVNIDDHQTFNQNKLQHGNEIKISAITPTVVRGEKRRGRTIRGKKCRTAVELGYLSHRAVTG